MHGHSRPFNTRVQEADVGDPLREGLDQVDRFPLHHRRHLVDEASVVDRVAQVVGRGRGGGVDAEGQVDDEGLTVAALFARSYLSLRSDVHGRTVLVWQGMLRRYEVRLSEVGEVCVIDGPARRALVLDRSGRVIRVVGSFLGFWRRPDVLALLGDEGVAVRREILLDRSADIEAAYPGSTAWFERSKLRLYAVITPPLLLGVVLLAMFLEP